MNVLKRSLPGGNLLMMLTFTQPVDATFVEIVGNEMVTVEQSTSDTSLLVGTVLSATGTATFLDMVVNTTVAAQVGDSMA